MRYVPYARPGELADDAEKGLWDIGLIGAEPQRAAVINFTAAYVRDRGDLSRAGGLSDHAMSPRSTNRGSVLR